MEYTVFKVFDELFGIPVLTVQEIARLMPSFPIPGHDPRIEGLVNLRGNAVAAINMRRALFPEVTNAPPAPRPKLIVLESASTLSTDAKSMGMQAYQDPVLLLVDDTHRIVALEGDSVEPAPAHLNETFVDGIIKFENSLITMLSIPKLIESIHSNPWRHSGTH